MMHNKVMLGVEDIIFKDNMYIMVCPICGMYHGSNVELEMMPEIDSCMGFPEHEDWKLYKKERGLTNTDIAKIVGLTADSVKSMTQPNKPLPAWAKAMLYEWKQ